jgi:hypothetical protein
MYNRDGGVSFFEIVEQNRCFYEESLSPPTGRVDKEG